MGARILALLENDEQKQQVTQSLWRSNHYVLAVENFAKAISILRTQTFDLILSEVHLENGGSVFDFLVWAKRNFDTRTTPFILFNLEPSARGLFLEDGMRTTARLLGASLFITMDRFNSIELCREIDFWYQDHLNP